MYDATVQLVSAFLFGLLAAVCLVPLIACLSIPFWPTTGKLFISLPGIFGVVMCIKRV